MVKKLKKDIVCKASKELSRVNDFSDGATATVVVVPLKMCKVKRRVKEME